MEKITQSNGREGNADRIPTATEKMRSYLSGEHTKLNNRLDTMQSDVPNGKKLAISEDFRIIPPPELYGEQEKSFDDERARQHYGTTDKTAIRHTEDNRAGTQFEILSTAIMHKHMGNRFIVVRSSRYDDERNGVDNILVDTKTGQTVCAFDETNANFKAKALIEKTNKVLSKNLGTDIVTELRHGIEQKTGDQGVHLKYGIKMTDGKIECSEMEHLPIFLLALDYEQLEEGQQTFVNGEGKGRYETKLFKYFLTCLSAQIQILKLNKRYDSLSSELRTRIESFENYIYETLPKL